MHIIEVINYSKIDVEAQIVWWPGQFLLEEKVDQKHIINFVQPHPNDCD